MHLVDDELSLPQTLDGFDQWDVLSDNRVESRRSEILHNIDPNANASALRVGNMKVTFSILDINQRWKTWFIFQMVFLVF